MTRDYWYTRLRDIGASVETSDAIAPELAELPPKRAEAFLLWANGCNQGDAARAVGISLRTFERDIHNIRMAGKNLPRDI